MRTYREIIFVLAIGLSASGAVAAQSEEAKLVEKMFGQRIAQATGPEILALAREMFNAANDRHSSDRLRFALASKAVVLAGPVGTDQAAALAIRALDLADSVQPFKASQRARLAKDIAVHRMRYALSHRLPAEQIKSIARGVIRSHLEFVDAARSDEDMTPAAAQSLQAARMLLQRHRLPDMRALLDEADKAHRAATARKMKLKIAKAALARAEGDKDEKAILAARRKLGRAYLDCDADLATAAMYLTDTGDPLAQPVADAVAFFAGKRKVHGRRYLKAVEALTERAAGLSGHAREKLAQYTLFVCEAYLARRPAKLDAAKARLLMLQLQKMARQTESDKLLKRLRAAYGPIGGRLEIIGEDRIRLTYDLTEAKQMSDWVATTGMWSISRGVMVCRTRGKAATIRHKLRFRADRPMKVSLETGGAQELRVGLQFYRWGGAHTKHRHMLTLSAKDGASALAFGNYWRSRHRTLQPNRSYRIQIALDGRREAAFSIDGVQVHKQNARRDSGDLTEGSLTVFLRALATGSAVAGFRNIVVEGSVLPRGNWSPPERQQETERLGRSRRGRPRLKRR